MSTIASSASFAVAPAVRAPRRFWLLRMLDAWHAHQREALAIHPRCD